MRRCLMLIALLWLPAAYADLRATMSEAEFRAAGLHKLSADELAALEAWIEGRGAATASSVPEAPAAIALRPATPATAPAPPVRPAEPEPAATPEDRFGREQLVVREPAGAPEQITARIVGEFRGWDGDTVFRLDNGQIWRQRLDGKYRGPKRENPEVVIEKGRFGYYLRWIEFKRTVGVKRVR